MASQGDKVTDGDTFGVGFPPNMVAKIEQPLQYGGSRSARVRDLVRIGLQVEGELRTQELWPFDPADREDRVQDMIDAYLEQQQ